MGGRLGVSIIGCGRVARDHCRALRSLEGIELASLADSNQEAARRLAQEYGVPRWHTDYRRVLDDPAVAATLVALPTHLHHSVTMDALFAGKHVLVEKPMCESVAQAKELVEAAGSRGLVLMAGQVMRYMPIFVEAKRLIAEGSIGKPIHTIERRLCYRDEAFPWWAQTSGFLIAHHGGHTVDLFLWLFDSSPIRVYADASSHSPSYPGENDFGLQLVLSNDAVVSLHHSFLSRYAAHDIVIIGRDGTIDMECFSQTRLNGKVVVHGQNDDMVSRGFAAQAREFIQSILEKRQPASSAAEVTTTIRVIEAAQKSVKEHRVVELA